MSLVKLAVPFAGTCGCWEETCKLGLSRSGAHDVISGLSLLRESFFFFSKLLTVIKKVLI
jgi:hypothetical protein